jgi:hypothetical protein
MRMPYSAQYWTGRHVLLKNRMRHAAERVGLLEEDLEMAGDGKC